MERRMGHILVVLSVCLISIRAVPLWVALFMALGGMAWLDN